MGWLFAVALGLQERSRTAVLRAFGPIALGHAAWVAMVVALVGALQVWIAPEGLRVLGASALVVFGLYKLLAPMSHPRWVGMRVGARDLTVWSFLMATAHGAGLMLVPVLLDLPIADAYAAADAHADHALMMTTRRPQGAGAGGGGSPYRGHVPGHGRDRPTGLREGGGRRLAARLVPTSTASGLAR